MKSKILTVLSTITIIIALLSGIFLIVSFMLLHTPVYAVIEPAAAVSLYTFVLSCIVSIALTF